jgi:outer membrane receptor for ferrienterochelin and colicins
MLFTSLTTVTAQPVTGRLNGSVLNSNGQAMGGQTLVLQHTPYTTTSTANGRFSFTAPAGNYTLLVQAVGYAQPVIPVTIEAGKTTTLRPVIVQEIYTALQDVTVSTGQFQPQSLRNSVYQVRVISHESIVSRGATDVLGVLNTQLGIRFSNDLTLGETNVSMMGMSGQYVKVLLDGVPVINRDDANQSLSQINISTIDHIEIVEGPMSVVYGTNAQAGVINIITQKNKGRPGLSVAARVQEETAGREYSGFSGKGQHNAGLNIGWKRGSWQLTGYGTRNHFGGWQGEASGREREWKPKRQWLTGGTLGFNRQHFKAWYRLDYLHEQMDAPGRLNTNNYIAVDQHYITNRYTHMLQVDWHISSRLGFTGAASYQQYRRQTRTVRKDFITGKDSLTGGEGEQDLAKFNSVFFRGTFQYKLSAAIALQPGMEIKSDHAYGDRIQGSPTISDYAAFVSAEIRPVTGVQIRPGLRISRNSVYDAPPLIPSIHTQFVLSKNLDLRIAYARGFRAPALRELYFSFHDANHSIEGNPGLKAERSGNLNLYLNWQANNKGLWKWTATAGAFYNHFTNQIDLATDPSNPQVYRYFNKEKFNTTGVTMEHRLNRKNLEAGIGFSWIGRYNLLSADPAYKNEQLPAYTWSPEINSNLQYRFARLKALVSLFYKYTGRLPLYEIDAGNNNQVHLAKTAAYHWMDITLQKQLTSFLQLNAGVKNLLNVTRLQNSSVNTGTAHNTGGPVPMGYGRSYFAGLAFQWSKQ